jgi:hypothetical protein
MSRSCMQKKETYNTIVGIGSQSDHFCRFPGPQAKRDL